jgi:hypothetical protein
VEDRNVEVKGTVPDFLLTEWLDNWSGRQQLRSEGKSVRFLLKRMARQLKGKTET